MLMPELIARKKAGLALSDEEIAWWVNSYVKGVIPDYQVAALLMAICFRGMSSRETTALTMAMAHSGDMVDLSTIEGFKVDKHSTGGVADTTTLIATPIAAACGVKVAKMSGRGLGHTGGTVDKLESIPGFDAALSPERFVGIVNRVGLAVTGQSGNLVPADKALYALRDVTATVDSIPLIASSVMSKKIAAGADAIVLDVKTGDGAFMRDLQDAFELARVMVEIGSAVGKRTVALVTDMDQPLGMAVGNSLEVQEALEVLKGKTGGALRDLSILLAAEMLAVSMYPDRPKARRAAEDALISGRALERFRMMIEAQGGNSAIMDDPELLPQPKKKILVLSNRDGFVTGFDTEAVGRAAVYLGAGRAAKEDELDYAAGIMLNKRAGDRVIHGEMLAVMHAGDRSDVAEAEHTLRSAIHIGSEAVMQRPLVFGRVTSTETEIF
ncbi:thymidine phosphorylase [Paracidobacterium acidisoli]|uniref:thymidine phosphorylase n=1 Tax=Paracidobacterium acidisoli TaxID=2303751 RepID=A0A372IIT3_9BACT|nr:thymidine phosphorylase [Paracidobacterium acidisoli]MBT9333294.1 thymidine phosphorylase [Paracidobacterium acidisoli]